MDLIIVENKSFRHRGLKWLNVHLPHQRCKSQQPGMHRGQRRWKGVCDRQSVTYIPLGLMVWTLMSVRWFHCW